MASILVVDDREINREFLVTLLNYQKHQLYEAADGEKAWEIIQKNKIDLIITDILMPNINGYELAQKIHASSAFADIPVIFYTATYRREEARLLADSCFVQYVLTKPCDPEMILKVVQKALSKTKKMDKLIGPNISSSVMENARKKIFKSQRRVKSADFLAEYSSKKKLTNKQLELFNRKLFTLLQLNLQLISERNIETLSNLIIRGAQDFLETEYCNLILIDSKGKLANYYVFSRNKNYPSESFSRPKIGKGLIQKMLKYGKTVKINKIKEKMVSELVDNHPPIVSVIGMPLITTSRLYGCIYFCNKVDATPFSEEDELFVKIFATEVSIVYENLELYEIIQRHAANLQLEVAERKNTEEKLSASEAIFRQFAENIKSVFWRTTPYMEAITYISPAYDEIWGRDREILYQDPLTWLEAIVPEDRERVKEAFFAQAQNDTPSITVEYKIMRPDKTIRYIYDCGFLIKNSEGVLTNVIGIATDISEHYKSRQILEVQHGIAKILERASSIQPVLHEILKVICTKLGWEIANIWMVDERTKKLCCSENYCVDFGLKESSFVNESLNSFISPGEELLGMIWQSGKSVWLSDLTLTNWARINLAKNENFSSAFGVPIIFQKKLLGVIEFFSTFTQHKDDDIIRLVEVLSERLADSIAREKMSAQLEHVTHYDTLTGLLRRQDWEEELNYKISGEKPSLMATLLFEIDRFQTITDTIGHDTGDRLLQLVADRLKIFTQKVDSIVGRLGLNKFVIAFTDCTSIEDIMTHITHLLAEFKLPFLLEEREVYVTISIGISIYPQDGSESRILLRNADAALDKAKEHGGNYFQFCTQDMPRLLIKKLELEQELRQALLQSELCLYYQPKVDLHTGVIVGLEALIRWQHPSQGLLPPSAFFSIIESTDLIEPVGKWILKEACQQILQFNKKVPIAVNISIRQFGSQYRLVQYIKKLLKDTAIPPQLLELEITESLLFYDLQHSLHILADLKKLDIRLSLDDFGTGYCSLNYLKHFPVDKIKIDKSFIELIPADEHSKAIVTALIVLAHTLKIKVVAEGVETIEQLKFLRQAGADEMQGYYFSPPVNSKEIATLLKKGKKLDL